MKGVLKLLRFAVAAAGAAACGGDNPVAPVHPVAVEILDGDDQSALVGQELPLTLDVLVLASNGGAMQEARIDWAVTSGGGTLSRTATTTDDFGQSSVRWTLGPTPGPQTVTATVESLETPVVFTATAIADNPQTPPPPAPIILHFDGSAWTTSMNARVFGNFTSAVAVWSSPSITFVGTPGCGGNSMLTYSGGAWHPETCTANSYLVKSIWGFAADDVFALEPYQNRLTVRDNIFHFNGQSWETVFTSVVSDIGADGPRLRAIGGRNPHDVIAVGDGGKIIRGDGASWAAQPSGTAANLRGVWGDPNSTSAFAVGENGTIIHYDGSQWQTQASGTIQTLLSVWGSSASDVFAVGASGTILHYDGTSWSAQTSGTSEQLRGVWGESASSVFAVGSGSTILHYDGSQWTAQPVGAQIHFAGVSGNSSSDVFAVGTPF
jgi:hypothetical protein